MNFLSYIHAFISTSMLRYLGYFAAIFIGFFLSIVAGDGSILTVPVLVY